MVSLINFLCSDQLGNCQFVHSNWPRYINISDISPSKCCQICIVSTVEWHCEVSIKFPKVSEEHFVSIFMTKK